MYLPRSRRAAVSATLGAIALAAVACGSGDEPARPAAVSESPSPTPTSAPASIATPTTVPPTTAPEQPSPAITTTPAPEASPTPIPAKLAGAGEEREGAFFSWRIDEIGRGTKPAIALDSADTPHIAYMLEDRQHGFVMAAERTGGAWETAEIAEGYFYGPLDIAIGGDDVPQVVYHDHQALNFQTDLGDAVLAVRGAGGAWSNRTLEDLGHDGWDTRIYVDADGVAHISAIDPEEFGAAEAVEYYRVEPDGDITVEPVGSGQQTYKYATSVAVDSAGTAYVTFHEQDEKDLALAARTASGWVIETVDSEGDTGLFASMVIDSDDRTHISYFERLDDESGTVRYATRVAGDAAWEFRDVDALDRLVFGFEGARNITSVAVDSRGNPWVAYTDESLVKLARWNGAAWDVETVITAREQQRPFGQLVSLKLDSQDRPHLAWFEVTSTGPLDGIVMYAVGAQS